MPKPNEAWPILADTVRYNRRHAYYDETVEYADLCTKLISGEGCADLLQHIVSRETGQQFELRRKLFFPIPPAVCSKARVPFTEVTRVDGTITELSWDGNEDGPLKERLSDAMDKFWGERSFNDYMDERFLDLNRTDPNAFVVVEFSPFDHRVETAQPYPLEIFSEQAINYGRTFDRVDWLIAKFQHQYRTAKGDLRDGNRYVMYFGWVLDMQEIEFDETMVEMPDQIPDLLSPPTRVRINGQCFQVILREPFTVKQRPEFQGVQVGHCSNPDVQVPTWVSTIHPGIQRMLSTLKSGSEHALVMALMAHPKLYMFLPKCEGDTASNIACMKGHDPATGKQCSVCHGSGKRLPSGVLDALVLDQPESAEEFVVPLADMAHYHTPDTGIIKAIDDYLVRLEEDALRDIFTSVQHKREKATATATEITTDADAKSNAVLPYARKYAHAWSKLGRIIAAFVDADKGLVVRKSIPEDLAMESLGELLLSMQVAKPVASPDVISLIDERIMVKSLKGRPLDLRKYHVRKYFRPLSAVAEDMRKSAIDNGDVTMREKVLLLYESEVYGAMDDIEGFYYKSRDEQRKLIDSKVQEIVDRIKEEKALDVDFEGEMNERAGVGPDGKPIEETSPFENAA